jgi:arginase
MNYAISLADQVSQMLDQAAFPLLLGGDCSILLGPMLALKRRGVYGLVFIDGHNDFCYPHDPARFPMLAAASLDLALVTGHGPDALTDIQSAKPYVREEHVAVLGYWDELEYADVFDFASFAASRVGRFDVTHVRRQGAAQAAQEALAMLTRQGVDQFWIHLDVDVLDRTVMPAVDSPNKNGLTYGELIDIVRTFIASQRAVGMQLTIFDPDLDPEGRYAAELADAIVAIFHAPAGGDG